jgi:hypothetical protein
MRGRIALQKHSPATADRDCEIYGKRPQLPHGRGCGVGRTLGGGFGRGVGVGRIVAVGVAVGLGVGEGVGLAGGVGVGVGD